MTHGISPQTPISELAKSVWHLRQQTLTLEAQSAVLLARASLPMDDDLQEELSEGFLQIAMLAHQTIRKLDLLDASGTFPPTAVCRKALMRILDRMEEE